VLKTEGDIQAKAWRIDRVALAGVLIAIAAVSVRTPAVDPDMPSRVKPVHSMACIASPIFHDPGNPQYGLIRW
jgi:hypothetical protein